MEVETAHVSVDPQAIPLSEEKDLPTSKSTKLSEKETNPALPESAPAKKDVSRKKLVLQGTEYYVVTLEEVNMYQEAKDKYTEDTMSAFIIYMHSEFLKDLKSFRRKSKLIKALKSVGYVLSVAFVVALIVLLIQAFIL